MVKLLFVFSNGQQSWPIPDELVGDDVVIIADLAEERLHAEHPVPPLQRLDLRYDEAALVGGRHQCCGSEIIVSDPDPASHQGATV